MFLYIPQTFFKRLVSKTSILFAMTTYSINFVLCTKNALSLMDIPIVTNLWVGLYL